MGATYKTGPTAGVCGGCGFPIEKHFGDARQFCPTTATVSLHVHDVPANDPINHPLHYNSHPSGVEAITICEHMSFCVGNAVKYLFRAGKKGDELEDLKKSRWYIDREIQRIEKERAK